MTQPKLVLRKVVQICSGCQAQKSSASGGPGLLNFRFVAACGPGQIVKIVGPDPDHEQYSELPEKLFELFCHAKKMAREWIRSIPSLSMAWKNQYLEEEREIFQGDPWAYGLKRNFAVLSKFLFLLL